MKPAAFHYARPGSIEQAVALLVEHGDDAKVLAGGQSLVPLLNVRLARPGVLVDLGAIAGLDTLTDHGDSVRIGAMTRQSVVTASTEIGAASPLIGRALDHVGHVQIRNRGTIGGSLAHADPAAELPAVAIALDARMHVVGPAGERSLRADSFFTGPFTTALAPAEILTGIDFSATRDRPVAFAEVARRSGDFAIAGVAAASLADGLRIVACGVGWTPVRLTAAESVVDGRSLTDAVIREAAAAAREQVDPADDVHGDAEYRRELVEVLVTRTLGQVAA
jgi:carbon-monoxide dehydrogenase medium subunit